MFLQARLGLQYLLDEGVSETLSRNQKNHGRKLLTKEYTKLYRFMMCMQSIARKVGGQDSAATPGANEGSKNCIISNLAHHVIIIIAVIFL